MGAAVPGPDRRGAAQSRGRPALNERFIRPQAADTLARLKAAEEQGQLAPDFDLDLAFEILSGPLYYRLLITHEPLTHAYIDRVLQAVLAGIGPLRQ